MPSILEYAETEFSLLAEKPFTDVDSLLLSQFSYMNLSAFEDELKCENKIETVSYTHLTLPTILRV